MNEHELALRVRAKILEVEEEANRLAKMIGKAVFVRRDPMKELLEVLRGARKANLSRIFQLFPSQDPALQRELVYGPGARLLERTYRLSAYGAEKLTPKPPAEPVAEAAP